MDNNNSINCSINQCLYEISKTMFGELHFENETKEQCDNLGCVIITTSYSENRN
jgi:sialic acid synthase SpsE